MKSSINMIDWKQFHCVQDNGPNYYAITDGKWGSPSIANCFATEREARILAASTRALEALNLCLEDAHRRAGHRHMAIAGPARQQINRIKPILLDAGYTD